MDQWTLYHNPKCSKSRQCLALLEARNIEFEIVEYLKTPPDLEQLKALQAKLGLPPREWIRTGEAIFKELSVDLENDTQVLNAIVAHPEILQRPIVERGSRAVVGRPPENVEQLF